MKCPKCRKQLRKGAKFCPACGARVEKKRGIRFTSILLVIVLLFSIVAIGWSGGILFAKHFGEKFRDLFSRKETIEIHNVEEAIAHAKELGEEYGYKNALSELTEIVTATIDGDNYYRLQQNYQEIPVYGRTVVCATDKDGNVTSITGNVQDVDAEINLTPTITAEQAQQSIQVYRTDVLNLQISEPITIELCKENLYVYIDADQPALVYSFLVGANRVILDAHDARILSWIPVVMPNEIWYTGPEETKSVLGTNPIEGRYILKDAERNIYVYDAQGQTYWYPGTTQKASSMKIDVPILVNSTDMEFGNDDDNTDSSGIAYIFLNELGTVYDFFAKMGETGVGTFVGICNDLMNDPDDPTEGYQGRNGGGYCGPLDGMLEEEFPDVSKPLSDINAAVIIIGSAYNRNMSEIYDLFGHEYQHTVFQKYVIGGSNSKEESGAIDEGIADIMGELYEASRGKINWEHGNRIIHDPSQKGYPESVNEINSKLLKNLSTDFSHGCSTVISHSAYLMWNGIDGNNAQRLSTEELAELWYRAVLMMPSDCDFNECRELVELAATTMTLSTAQRACVAEAFDNVGITGTSQSNDSKVIIFTASGETAIKGSVYEVKVENGIETIVPVSKATVTVYSGNSTKSYKKMNMKNEDGFFEIELPAGTYSVAITADGYIGQTISFELADNEVRYFSVELEPSNNKTGNNTDAYSGYLNAVQKTTESGNWSEHLAMTADMAITDGSAKTKTKVTLTSDADVFNYSESNPSQIRMSGSAEMTVMGQLYTWNMEYENGTAHYLYTKPNQTSADMKIDPSFFNFGTMTSDMMTNAKLSGNKITFTVPGEKIAEVGIAAVNQMSGVDNLEYGDVDVTVTISDDGKIDNIVMVFHASLEYQGYDADVDYNINYRFSENNNTSSKPAFGGVQIVPGIYAQDGSGYNTLTVHETDRQTLEFTAFWYRIADIYHAIAEVNGDNVASFAYVGPNVNWQAAGTLQSPSENTIVLTISDSTHEYISTGEYRYSLIGKIFSDAELKAISAALNVPDDLDAEITQGEPGYWEGGGIYRTPIEIYYNGELIAGASVNSLTGELVGAIYTYSGHTEAESGLSEEDAYAIACKYWNYTENAVHEETGYELTVISDGLIESGDGNVYYAFRLRWLVPASGTTSTLEYLYVNEKTGECKHTIDY